MLSKKRIIKLIILFFLLVNLSALIVAGRGGGKEQKLGMFGLNLFSPIEEFFLDSIHGISDIWNSYFNLINVENENRKLKKEVLGYKAKETEYKESYLENKRLRKLLSFKEKIANKVIAAEVTGRDSSKWFNTIIINRGSSAGVEVNFPVIVPQGVVGQVIDVSKNYSKVLLITDRMSGIDSLVQEQRGRGIVEGTGGSICELKYLLRKFEIKKGDDIITSGMDGVFPKGFRIGQVVDIIKKSSGIFQDVKVKPFVDFQKLEEVLIIIKPLKNTQ